MFHLRVAVPSGAIRLPWEDSNISFTRVFLHYECKALKIPYLFLGKRFCLYNCPYFFFKASQKATSQQTWVCMQHKKKTWAHRSILWCAKFPYWLKCYITIDTLNMKLPLLSGNLNKMTRCNIMQNSVFFNLSCWEQKDWNWGNNGDKTKWAVSLSQLQHLSELTLVLNLGHAVTLLVCCR